MTEYNVTATSFCPWAAQAAFDVERMLRGLRELIAEADARRARARTAFAGAPTLFAAVACCIGAGDTAVIVGSHDALDSVRLSPDATRMLLRLIDDGLVALVETPYIYSAGVAVVSKRNGLALDVLP